MTGRQFLALAAIAVLGACGDIRAGGQYSGVPDTFIGQRTSPLGEITTDGQIRLQRETDWR